MGNRLCDCNKAEETKSDELIFNGKLPILDKTNNLIHVQSLKEDSSTQELNKDEEMKIEVIDSYDADNNVYSIDYIKRLIKLQRRIKNFLYYKKRGVPKKSKAAVAISPRHSRGSLYNSLVSYDIVSRRSSNISLRGFFIHNKSKYKYYGERVNGYKEGFGVIRFEDGSTFIGSFKNNKADGICMFKNSQGSVFNGKG
jgi:hypothetical protein